MKLEKISHFVEKIASNNLHQNQLISVIEKLLIY